MPWPLYPNLNFFDLQIRKNLNKLDFIRRKVVKYFLTIDSDAVRGVSVSTKDCPKMEFKNFFLSLGLRFFNNQCGIFIDLYFFGNSAGLSSLKPALSSYWYCSVPESSSSWG